MKGNTLSARLITSEGLACCASSAEVHSEAPTLQPLTANIMSTTSHALSVLLSSAPKTATTNTTATFTVTTTIQPSLRSAAMVAKHLS